ncbi:Phosphoribosylaminoimidazole-succinocarboxamide synthase [Candidatus Kinetoplastibacterium sorsogonicusi]|uniref:Phosphoribosylaminoimidazole-succinocarboxamide synthase n=1 Tax=Candidatus Kinetoplastidibacterium kentomonadis TaxID=1576550 RepID=A0A3Q8F698_9PROT|nr:phosphoribosylaminoimidazolesuccinocarboxamide synthase [Candidatus Kinetoplastibacterium sorsogonicusi]AWD32268.1 Phosphoribosylaminoimidazole-succinocarboxamide synthase [Candidatus Kinetoplastibacterium sorsogonicusi]
MQNILYESDIKSLPLLSKGKVRDIYLVENDKLLIITSDRISAFDIILSEPIPGKGVVLKKITDFWLKKLSNIVKNHSTNILPEEVVSLNEVEQVIDRAVVVKKLRPIMIEAVVRGYIIGSGWKEYNLNKSICGIKLPNDLKLADKLSQPIFTPAIKAEVGYHDQNIDFDHFIKIVGEDTANYIKKISLNLYESAYDFAINKGIIIADTKFEFGFDESGNICLMDEVLTPDSSRFWLKSAYKVGINPLSFDKQDIRDWLENSGWNKEVPPPKLPEWLIKKTSSNYNALLSMITN